MRIEAPTGSECRRAVPVPLPSVRTDGRQERRRYGSRLPASPRYVKQGSSFEKNACGGKPPSAGSTATYAHRANTALHFTGCGDATKCCSHHIAVFERGAKPVALVGVMAQPVEQFREPHSLEYTPPHQSIASSLSRCAASVISCASCLAR